MVISQEELREVVKQIISNRCEFHSKGKISPGQLQTYTYYKLNEQLNRKQDYPKANWAAYITKLLAQEYDIIKSMYESKPVYRGIAWKREDHFSWNCPGASDIPKWSTKVFRYQVLTDSGMIDTRYLNLKPIAPNPTNVITTVYDL